MREEEEGKWFARWEEELPSPEELMPLSQTLFTADLALAFDIPNSTIIPSSTSNPNPTNPSPPPSSFLHHQPPPPAVQQLPEFDSGDLDSGNGGGADEPARTLKRPRLVWTPQLHKRFVEAVAHLGIKNAVPKNIMQLMSVEGLTRENVASHLQKYRLHLKRMQDLSSSRGGGGPISAADAAIDQLFASAPVPHHFLSRGAAGPGPEPFMPYVPVAALQLHQHMAAAAAAAAAAQQHYYHQRQMGHFGSPAGGGGGFDHGFLARPQPQPGMHCIVGPAGLGLVQPPPPPCTYAEDLDPGGGGRRVLTLFPTGDD